MVQVRKGRPQSLRAVYHRPELQHEERPAARTDATVAKDHRPVRIQLDHGGDRQEHRREDQQPDRRADEVRDALNRELLRLQRLCRELDERLPAFPHDARLHAGDLERARHGEHMAASGD